MEKLGRIEITSFWGKVVWAGVDKKKKPIFVNTDGKTFFFGSAPCPQYVTQAQYKKIVKRLKHWSVIFIVWVEVG